MTDEPPADPSPRMAGPRTSRADRAASATATGRAGAAERPRRRSRGGDGSRGRRASGAALLIGLLALGFALVGAEQRAATPSSPTPARTTWCGSCPTSTPASSGCARRSPTLQETRASSAPARRGARRRWPRPAAAPTSWASSPGRCRRRGTGCDPALAGRAARSGPPPCSRRSRSCAAPGPRRCRSPAATAPRYGSSPPRYFVDGADGRRRRRPPLSGPYTITVIGPAATMQTALTIPGGVADAVGRDGGTVIVDEPGTVQVDRAAPGRGAGVRPSDRVARSDDPDERGRDVIPDDLRYTAKHEWVAGDAAAPCGSASPISPRTRWATSSSSSCPSRAPRCRRASRWARSSPPRACRRSTPR